MWFRLKNSRIGVGRVHILILWCFPHGRVFPQLAPNGKGVEKTSDPSAPHGKSSDVGERVNMLRSAFSVCLFQMQWPMQRTLSGLLVTTMSLWLICFRAAISKPAGQMARPPIGFTCICWHFGLHLLVFLVSCFKSWVNIYVELSNPNISVWAQKLELTLSITVKCGAWCL